ncbi:MAG: insulinase family protein [Planctomycetota bacterium]|nr:MAG: insulinase family protein [Planctomycetota bacterium]
MRADRPPLRLLPAPGLELLVLPDARFKRALLQVHFDSPFTDGRSPARVLAAQILEQGTRSHPSQMHLTRAEESLYGASVGLDGRRLADGHRVTLAVSWVGERFLPAGAAVQAGVCALARELLEEPARDAAGQIPAATLERERRQLLRRIRSLSDDRAAYSRQRFLQLLCGDDPFGRPLWGGEEEVAALKEEDLEAARHGLLEQARISAVLVGPADPEEVAAFLADWFGAGGPHADAVRPPLPPVRLDRPDRLREDREALPLDQARLHFGFRFPPPATPEDFEALTLANAILGGGAQGRLFRIVREQRSLCYGISSSLRARKGILAVGAGIDAASYREVRDEILAQAAVVAAGDWSEEEEAAARAGLRDQLDSLADSPSGLARFHDRERLLGFRRTPSERVRDVAAVTRERIAAAAAAWEPALVYLLAPVAAGEEAA